MDSLNLVLVLATLLVVGFYSIRNGLLSTHGVIIAIVFGLITFVISGINAFITLIFVYAITQLATKIAKHKKNHERRGLWNIVGNVGPAIIFLVLGFVNGFYGSIASAIADTTASEVGSLSKKKPKLITTFKEVEEGTDGGITLLGSFSALVFSLAIGLIFLFLVKVDFASFLGIVIAGFLGMVIDSLLGATLQKSGLLDNNQVNFIANFFAGSLSIIISFLI